MQMNQFLFIYCINRCLLFTKFSFKFYAPCFLTKECISQCAFLRLSRVCWEENKTEITQFGHSIKWLFIVKIISSYKRTGNKHLFSSKGKGKNTPCVTLRML